MPIKACTRCGLKVLVDAATAASDTYLCPRCAPDAKPSTGSRPSSSPGGKRPSVKVSCPYCGASFSGSMPSRPAKGGCPVCRKELVLLPDGTIQAAATFNLMVWQQERDAKKSASNPPAVPPAAEAAPELPSTPDPLGGSTILDMGGPPAGAPAAPMPSLDEPTMALPEGLGGETMLGMGHGMSEAPPPAPSIEESPPAPMPEPVDESEPPPDLGGATILDMGPRSVEPPPPEIDEPPPDLLSESMPGMDRPPSEESPVAPPIPPPIPEPEPDVTEEPTVRDVEPEPEPAPEPEPSPASIDSVPELPSDLGGQTILGMGEELQPRTPDPVPSIEEPEAVPILANDVAPDEPAAPDAEEEAPAPGQATPKPYIYQPIPRKARSGHVPAPPSEAPASVPRMAAAPPAQPPPPPPSGAQPPVLGSDFRIAAAPPPPKPVEDAPREERRKPAGPATAAVVLPRASHSLKKLVTAWVLLLLPLAAGFVLHSLRNNPGVADNIRKITNQTLPGIRKLEGEIRKAAQPADQP